MKQLKSFIRKEFLHIFRDPRTLIILFGMPAMQIIIFGYVVTMDVREARIGIVDYSRDPVSRHLAQKFDASEFFKIVELPTESDMDGALKSGRIKAALVFKPDFAASLQREGAAVLGATIDASEPNMARLLSSYLEAIIADFNREQVGAPIVGVTPKVRMVYNPALKNEFMFVPGLMTLILMLICTLMTSVTITREKEFGIMEVLLVSPLRPIQIILGKVTPYLALGFADVILILVMANLIFGLPIRGSLTLLLAESLLYIALALSLGILISTISKTMQQAMFISLIGLLLPSVLLSGFIFPLENMPMFYQALSLMLPPRWFIVIIKNIMLKGTGFALVWKETLVLIGMTVFFIAMSAKKFKLRLE